MCIFSGKQKQLNVGDFNFSDFENSLAVFTLGKTLNSEKKIYCSIKEGVPVHYIGQVSYLLFKVLKIKQYESQDLQ